MAMTLRDPDANMDSMARVRPLRSLDREATSVGPNDPDPYPICF